MCGRFAQTSSAEALVDFFGLAAKPHIDAHYNIAPTQSIIVIRQHHDGRHANTCRWGLVPSWAESIKVGQKLFNARAETVFEKRSFCHAARHQRCVIPSSGFYEWRDTPVGKMPTLFTPTDSSLFCFAGLWSSWSDRNGNLIYTATILTTSANPTMQPFHHRMPVLLHSGDVEQWLNPTVSDPAQLLPLLKSAPCNSITLRAVSKRVNSVRNDDPRCWENAGAREWYSKR